MKVHLLLVVALGACATTEPEVTAVESALKCPVYEDCLSGNGGGVYTTENGFAGIGPKKFLIAHLINTGTGVSIEGRYYSAVDGYWKWGTGSVTGADYQGQWYLVDQISESLTTPTFTLSRYGVPTQVTGPAIVRGNTGFTLHIALDDGTGEYDLGFNSYLTDATGKATIRTANMLWRSLKQSVPWTQYCFLSDGVTADPLVFQQGIGVHPVTADLVYNSAYVTAGCRNGGMATVRSWGYTYRINTVTADLFKAALHMKRASYCGDQTFYTESGTQIRIKDSAGVNSDPISPREASWDVNGATCVNLQYLRHGDVAYPAGSSNFFDGKCRDLNGVVYKVIQPCSGQPLGDLASGAETPIPSPWAP